MRQLAVLITFLFFSPSTIFASTQKDGFWFGTFSNSQLTEKYSYWIEGQLRYSTDRGETAQFLYRTGLIQRLGVNHALAYLYAYIQAGTSDEHRLALQHTMTYGSMAQFKASHRVRLEYRQLENNSSQAGRFRYLWRVEDTKVEKFGLVVWDEIFLNLNKTTWNGNDTIDRNRFFLGVKVPFFNKRRTEIGYLNQYTPRDSGDISEHLLVAYLFF